MSASTSVSTISQGLRRCKKLKGRMAELKIRTKSAARFEASRRPAFDFKMSRTELAEVRAELIRVQAAIARANAVTQIMVEDRTMSIAEAIRLLEEFKDEMSWLPELPVQVSHEETVQQPENEFDENLQRHVRKTKELKFIAELTEAERAEELRKLQDRFEAVNDAVERANHTTQLVM